ncbi:potassium channel protein [Paenibacillus oceani]|uniref:Potassium channel protein n=1 Tax=Paenibacillus oceani TaxID=2772510 RepID=A0A927C3C8_9BACL|nr:potassium channel family protein [Paenibacillus oceani]MBD2860564.1 potassium channel protein [Paenibacillus oceani]
MLFFSRLFLRMIHMSNRVVFGTAGLLLLLSSFLIYWLEPETYENPFNGFWWVMTTVTTVGYGDFYPHTVPGKLLGIFLYLFGISLISVVISKMIDFIFAYHRKKEEGKLRYTGESHFVLIDWSKHAELAIQEIRRSDPEAEIVLIAQLPKTPISDERVHYIQGNPVLRETLDSANLSKARSVFLFADDMTENQLFIRDSSFIDGKTLLIATTIERYFQHVHTVVEVRDRNNIPNFTHVKVDEFIVGSETVSRLAVRSAFNHGASRLVSQLLTSHEGGDLYEIRKRPQWKTFRDAFEELLREGATLLSDGDNLNVSRRLDEPIPEDAKLFVICDSETYTRLIGGTPSGRNTSLK